MNPRGTRTVLYQVYGLPCNVQGSFASMEQFGMPGNHMADDAVIDVEPLFLLAVILIGSRGPDGSGPVETRVV